jgi:NAD(P)-dependent dehydrogenase (short-subunit alcohol dehydrogenase family)
MGSRIFKDGLLAGRRALVTGGGTGIGKAIALELAGLGADVAVLGRRREPLEQVAAEIIALGRRAAVVPADIREPAQVAAAVGQAIEQLGGLDVLVNNAGGQFVKATAELSVRGWDAVIDTNLNGTFHVTPEVARRALIPGGGGVIVNIIIDMWRGTPGAAHAGAARAAVDNLTKTLAIEWAAHGIRVNAIAPGTIDSGGLSAYPPHVVEALKQVVPLGRLGRPDEVAWLCAYLASEAGAWISGETLCIDGAAKLWGGLWSVLARAKEQQK